MKSMTEARLTLQDITWRLHSEVVQSLPESAAPSGGLWPCVMSSARLSMEPMRVVTTSSTPARYRAPFEVAAYSRVTVNIPPDESGYEGRSHSLWYCDAQEAGVFRWYETAFMLNAWLPNRRRLEPFALEPGDKAFSALLMVRTMEYQLAWPFTPVDQGCETEFIDRWLAWFTNAAEGRLSHPRRMPERDPSRSWRRPPGT